MASEGEIVQVYAPLTGLTGGAAGTGLDGTGNWSHASSKPFSASRVRGGGARAEGEEVLRAGGCRRQRDPDLARRTRRNVKTRQQVPRDDTPVGLEAP